MAFARILVILTLMSFQISEAQDQGPVVGIFSQQGQTAQLEIKGRENWIYDVTKESDGTSWKLELPKLSDDSIKRLRGFHSSLIKSVEVENEDSSRTRLRIKTAKKNIDAFDYITTEPNRLLVDFYHVDNQDVANSSLPKKSATLKSSPLVNSHANSLANSLANSHEKNLRSPAGEALKVEHPEGVETESISEQPDPKGAAKEKPDENSQQRKKVSQKKSQQSQATNEETQFNEDESASDANLTRFAIKPYEISEESILRSKEDYYIAYPMLQLPLEVWEKIKVSENVYEIESKDSEENKQARLLLTLFKNRRFLVYMKVLAWFREKFPHSEYNEVIDFMTADVHLELFKENKTESDKEKAFLTWELAIQRFPKSKLSEKTSLKLGFYTLEEGDGFNALRYFNNHINNPNINDKSYSKDLAKLGSAMAMLKLNRVGDALKLLEDLETTSTHRDIAIEAAYRKGDAYIQKKDYDVAAQEFKNSQKKYPKEIDRFPNAMYNQAESLFAVRKYQESLEQYRQFLIHFPKEDHAAFAMTRVGELLGILGADKKRVMGTYMETVFRFGERPSANIAQMRLATEKMKTAREREFKPLMKQIEKFAGALKIPNMEQFTNVLVAEGFASRGRYQDAIDRLVEFYQTNPISADKDMISKRIVSYINQQLQSNVDQGDYIAALILHQKYAESWLKNTPQLAARFNVGKSLEFSGAPEAGEKFYRDVLNSSLAINGTEESKILKANGTFPNLDEVNLRLAAVNDQMDRTARSFEYIKQIKSPEKLSEENQIERIRIMTGLLEKRGDPESAVRYLTELLKLWRGEASKVAPLYLKLAKLEEKLGRRADAEASLKKVDELYGYAKTADPEVHSQALLTLGDYYINEGKTKLAIAQLDKVLEKYEDNKSLAPVRFKVGELHFNNGDLNKAEKSWSGFKGPNADIWDKLAKEKMASVKWQDEYKKYLKRIPAMTGVQ